MIKNKCNRLNNKAFTIVELLIVVVVIAILATISIVAYNGIQQRSRDSERKSELSALSKAIELYYVDHDEYPHCGSGATDNNSDYSGCSAVHLSNQLVPDYIDAIPEDPVDEGGTISPATPNMRYMYSRGYAASGTPSITHYNTGSISGNSARKGYSLGTYMEVPGCDNGCSTNWAGGNINYVIGADNN